MAVVDNVFVEDATVHLGKDTDRLAPVRYVDAENLIVVLFDDPALAYIDGSLYRTDGVQTAIDRLVRGGLEPVMRAGIEHVASGLGTIRRVLLVTSSLRRADLEAQFVTLAARGAVRPNFV